MTKNLTQASYINLKKIKKLIFKFFRILLFVVLKNFFSNYKNNKNNLLTKILSRKIKKKYFKMNLDFFKLVERFKNKIRPLTKFHQF